MLKLLQSLAGLVLLTFSREASAFLRFPCSQLVTERFDPYVHTRMCIADTDYNPSISLVTPGEVSPHLHQIVGGVRHNSLNQPSAR